MRPRWTILIAAFFGVFASFSSVFIFTFSVFLKPLSAEFGWSRTQISGGFSLAAITVAFASPVIGRLVDRFGSRAVILPCATLFAAGFASLSFLTPSLAQLYVTLFLIGIVGNGTTQLAFSRAVVKAFDNNRGIALASMLAGSGVGGMLMPILAQAGIDNLGWRGCFQALGAMVAVVAIPLTAWLIPGDNNPAARTRRTGSPAALRSRLFWTFLVAFFLMSLAVNAALAHLSPLLTDRGFTPQVAALGASILGASTLLGRLGTGWLLDRWAVGKVAGLLFAGGALGLLGLAVVPGAPGAFISAGLIGIGMGAESDVIPYLLSRYFPMETFGELYGYSFSAFALAGAIGPIIMGRAYDLAGSYDPVLGFFAMAGFLAAMLISRTPRTARLSG